MDILETIGNTPLVTLRRFNGESGRVRVLVKLEGNNPGGSIKDRAALYMIRSAQGAGCLNPSQTILEATSGNTGIALAMIGSACGYRVRIAMPAGVGRERLGMIKAFGAEVELTPAEDGTDGAIRRVREIYENRPENFYLVNQFANAQNIRAHRETTGPEIFARAGETIRAIVAGLGSCGTIMGVAEYFKEQSPTTLIVGVEPQKGHRIPGLKNMEESEVPKIFNKEFIDLRMTVNDRDAFDAARALALREGIFAGMSSGAAVCAALRLARDLRWGTIVAILPDRGDRYLSTNLFNP
ncbi:MAG TPA: PLP-dependent cysteine synthase family protein [Candidatus Aminicenantes bacterium]|nr:PLP-dependent cysteine synthase family protein [Candidatus Aminicenantes bacterium]